MLREELLPFAGRQDAQRCWVTAVCADVLEAPEIRAGLVDELTLGCSVFLLDGCLPEGHDGWVRVGLADGREGYMRSAHVRFAENFSASGETELRGRLTAAAKLYIGAQYRWGGKSLFGIDCSGLCMMAYWLNGICIYRDAKIMPGFPIKEISPADAQAGDLLFFPGHVGMVLCGETFIHSSVTGNGVRVDSRADFGGKLTCAGSIFL
jgi:hypothetical protein